MKKHTGPTCTTAISLLAASSLWGTQAYAQQIIAPPAYEFVDANGVNLVTGKFVLPGLNVDIGADSSGLVRVVNENSDNHAGALSFGFIAHTANGDNGPGQLTMDASIAGTVYRFAVGGGNTRATATVSSPGPYTQINGVANLSCTGNYTQRFAGGTCTMTLRDGAAAFYGYTSTSGGTSQWLIQTMTKPDGEVLSYTYYSNGSALSSIKSVSSSLGWMLKYEINASFQPVKVTAINTAAAYCDPAASSCSVSSSFPYVTSTTSGSTTTIARNGTTLKSYTSGANSTTITTSSGVAKTVTYSNGRVASVSVGGSTWNYGYQFSPTKTTVTNPDLTSIEISIGPYGVERETDESNAITWFSYDTSGNISTVQEFGTVAPYTTYSRDGRGNITSASVYQSGGGGTPLVTTAVYPASCSNTKTCNKPTSVTKPNGVTTTYTYDSNHGGVLTETSSPVNGIQAQTRYTYGQYTPYVKSSSGTLVAQSPVWRLSEISRCMTANLAGCVGTADEVRVVKQYTPNNLIPNVTTIKRGDGSLPQTTTLEISDNGWTTSVDGPRAGTVDKSFKFHDSFGRTVGEIGPDPDGDGSRQRFAVRTTYDTDGRVSKVEYGTAGGTTLGDLNAMTIKSYDATDFSTSSGLPIVERHYEGPTLTTLVQKSYDNRLRTSCVAERLNGSVFGTITSTAACTLGPAGPDGNDRITKYNYSSIGQITTITDAYGTPSARAAFAKTYSNNRTVGSITDGQGNKTAYTYDNFNRLTKTCYATPSNGSVTSTTDCEQLVYNTNGTVGSLILRDGQTISLGYDALGRLASKSGALTETRGYDNLGQLVSHTNNGVSAGYTYNSLGWLLSDTQPTGTVGYSYDATGRRSQLTYPGGFTVTYAYDDADNLTSLTPSSGIGTISLDYDNFGRRSHIYRGNNQTTTFGYDGASRLSSVAQGSANTLTFGYTQSHQIKSKTNSNSAFTYPASAGALTNYTIDGLNRISSVSSTSIGYDGRGNLASTGGSTYSYNADNLLTSATQSGSTSTLTYDAENRLLSIAKAGVTTRFLYDGNDLIAEYDGSGNLLRRYVHGSDSDEPLVWFEGSGTADVRFFHANDQGSVTSVTDASGTTRNINTYDAYGLKTSTNSAYAGRFGFTGQAFLSEIGLYYYKARLYSASFGRFMQTDPAAYRDSVNWYAYAHGDPINRRDPTGLTDDATYPIGEIVVTVSRLPECMSNVPGVCSYDDIAAYFRNIGLPKFPNERMMVLRNGNLEEIPIKHVIRKCTRNGESKEESRNTPATPDGQINLAGVTLVIHSHGSGADQFPGGEDSQTAIKLGISGMGVMTRGAFIIHPPSAPGGNIRLQLLGNTKLPSGFNTSKYIQDSMKGQGDANAGGGWKCK